MRADAICTHRVSIITGHYGTGKTEFAVNLALQLAGLNHQEIGRASCRERV